MKPIATDAGADAGRDAGSPSRVGLDAGLDDDEDDDEGATGVVRGDGGSRADGGVARSDSGTTGNTAGLRIEDVEDGAPIPAQYRCQGSARGASPAIAWAEGPAGTASYALVLRDITEPEEPRFHWVVYDIPATASTLPADLPLGGTLDEPAGAKQARNTVSRSVERGYRGPCPADDVEGRYEFKLHALDLPELAEAVAGNATTAEIVAAIEERTIASMVVTGTASAND